MRKILFGLLFGLILFGCIQETPKEIKKKYVQYEVKMIFVADNDYNNTELSESMNNGWEIKGTERKMDFTIMSFGEKILGTKYTLQREIK